MSESEIKEIIREEFRSFREEIKREILDNNSIQHSSKSVNLKFPGNQKQFDFNSEVLKDVDQVHKILLQSGDQENSLRVIEGTKEKLSKRNKKIRIADRSEGGWRTVAAYESDDLASDSDDDRKIKRAEKVALASISKKHFRTILTTRLECERPNDSELSSLMSSLPDVILKSKAKNTEKSYQHGFKMWSKWASKHHLTILPAKEINFCLFLVSLIQSNKSTSTIEESFYGVNWAHQLAGLTEDNPCQKFLVKSIREAAHRILGHEVKKKEPITPEILEKLVSKYIIEGNENSLNLRNISMLLIGYAGFMRFNEIVHVKRSHIVFYEDYMSVFIEHSKTDVYREGRNCLIAKTGSDMCPVENLQRYLRSVNLLDNQNADVFIYRQMTFFKKTGIYKLRNVDKPLSYTRSREILLDMLKAIGADTSKFGLHSLRSGGCTAAANCGVTDRLFKRHGRWASEKAKDGYVKDSIQNMLSVSRSLGI